MVNPKMSKEYAIKICGCVWDGDNVDDKCRFDTYEEAEAAIHAMREKSAECWSYFGLPEPKCSYTVVERGITPWRNAKPKED